MARANPGRSPQPPSLVQLLSSRAPVRSQKPVQYTASRLRAALEVVGSSHKMLNLIEPDAIRQTAGRPAPDAKRQTQPPTPNPPTHNRGRGLTADG